MIHSNIESFNWTLCFVIAGMVNYLEIIYFRFQEKKPFFTGIFPMLTIRVSTESSSLVYQANFFKYLSLGCQVLHTTFSISKKVLIILFLLLFPSKSSKLSTTKNPGTSHQCTQSQKNVQNFS